MISKEFLFGGHAIFTVANPNDEYYTFRVTAPDDQHELYPIWFLSVLTGPNNQTDYSYAATVRQNGFIKVTGKSKFTPDSKPVKVAQWAINLILAGGKLPEGYKIHHEGRCGKCGRPLTTPASIESGIGPICAGRG